MTNPSLVMSHLIPNEPAHANYDSSKIPLRYLFFDILKEVAKQLDIDNGSSLTKNWKILASILKFSESDIHGLSNCHPSITLKMLNEHFARFPDFTVQEFISVLERMGRQELALIVRDGLRDGLYIDQGNIRHSYIRTELRNDHNGEYALPAPARNPITSRDISNHHYHGHLPLQPLYEQSETENVQYPTVQVPMLPSVRRPPGTRSLMIYSHRSETHQENVASLAKTLCQEFGMSCMDPYKADEFHTENCCAFIASKMEEADLVFFVFDKNYLSDRDFDGEEVPMADAPESSPFEYNLTHIRALRLADTIMTNDIYAHGMRNKKFIFMLMDNGLPEYIPKICRMFKYFRWPQDKKGLMRLIRALRKKKNPSS
ncbi:uncharacterized protein TRIADDRAFT_52026 [Trichoplax adhaerens]|uniref:Uncharacterized protein n=1 Tax=Trichoplax adhaerens TaxID=10228 RepID=B3RLJ7_TRIAD|nr:predicted protein [Trichoplax adhaerens]EDV29548.1 predicted protein [Trichoplax adhaerens]|eukprot:XP_002108750.1 predicted protein [Trichoplax adhaerens]